MRASASRGVGRIQHVIGGSPHIVELGTPFPSPNGVRGMNSCSVLEKSWPCKSSSAAAGAVKESVPLGIWRMPSYLSGMAAATSAAP